MKDDVPEEVKKRRLQEIVSTFHSIAGERNKRFIGTDQLVLVEKVQNLFPQYYITVTYGECICVW